MPPMKLAIMQPYFFPYLGYFELIGLSDTWIVFDTVKYKPKSWMNRNRILHPTKGWQYVTAPVERAGGGDLISEIRVVDAPAAMHRLLGQIDHYRVNRAPFFAPIRELIQRSFDLPAPVGLSDLCVNVLAQTCAYIGLEFRPRRLSQMDLPLPPITYPGQWAPEISSVLNADVYINAPGGRAIFREEDFAARGMKLEFLRPNPFHYPTPGYDFVENLSIIDVLMWNPPETVRARLAQAIAEP
jgi:hypothetical protein